MHNKDEINLITQTNILYSSYSTEQLVASNYATLLFQQYWSKAVLLRLRGYLFIQYLINTIPLSWIELSWVGVGDGIKSNMNVNQKIKQLTFNMV